MKTIHCEECGEACGHYDDDRETSERLVYCEACHARHECAVCGAASAEPLCSEDCAADEAALRERAP